MATKFYGQSQETCEEILKAFETGSIVAPLAQVFVNRSDSIPSARWSWCNKLIQIMKGGTSDSRGFRQWQDAGRQVKAGARAFNILGPCIGKVKDLDEETGEEVEKPVLYGFKSIPVFKLEDTELVDPDKWSDALDEQEEERLRNLPLADVAEKWGLSVRSYNGKNAGAFGYYVHGTTIALGVENLSTWCHELVHAADDRIGTITRSMGQNAGNEIVAELGGAILLSILGYEEEADLGGCHEYISGYAGGSASAIRRSMALIDRICNCVDLILATAEGREPKVKERKPVAPAVKSGDYKGKALKAFTEYQGYVDGLAETDRAKVAELIVDRPASPGAAMMKIKKALA